MCHQFRVSKFFMLKWGMSPISVDCFCLAVPKNFVGETFCAVFQKIVGHEKVHGSEGNIRIFYESLLSQVAEELYREIL